jgi:hypothetical protein
MRHTRTVATTLAAIAMSLLMIGAHRHQQQAMLAASRARLVALAERPIESAPLPRLPELGCAPATWSGFSTAVSTFPAFRVNNYGSPVGAALLTAVGNAAALTTLAGAPVASHLQLYDVPQPPDGTGWVRLVPNNGGLNANAWYILSMPQNALPAGVVYPPWSDCMLLPGGKIGTTFYWTGSNPTFELIRVNCVTAPAAVCNLYMEFSEPVAPMGAAQIFGQTVGVAQQNMGPCTNMTDQSLVKTTYNNNVFVTAPEQGPQAGTIAIQCPNLNPNSQVTVTLPPNVLGSVATGAAIHDPTGAATPLSYTFTPALLRTWRGDNIYVPGAQNACVNRGRPCGRALDCCNVGDTCEGSVCCVGSGGACAGNGDCCSDTKEACVGGTCCQAAGAGCGQNSDCCAGSICINGTCGACVANGGGCANTGSNCCSEACSATGHCCAPVNGACNIAADCCPSVVGQPAPVCMPVQGGVSACCSDHTAACLSDSNCCSLHCNAGTCA